MANSVMGKIVDEHGVGIAGAFVQALQLNQLHGDVPLGVAQSDQSGFYNVPFDPMAPQWPIAELSASALSIQSDDC
jgi:hypothetical protein